MSGGGYQVGNVAGFLTVAGDGDGLHVLRVAGVNLDRDAGQQLAISMQQLHLSRLDQRVVVVADVADAIAFGLKLAMLPLPMLDVVLGVRESRDPLAVAVNRVPSTVIEMQMRVDDGVNVFGSDANSMERVQQLLFRCV